MSGIESSTTYDVGSLYATLLARVSGEITARGRVLVGEHCPWEGNWQPWLTHLFPKAVIAGFAPHHVAFWEWVASIQPGIRPQPYVIFWPRGGAKSSSAELATVYLGALGIRKYVLYVCGTQELADRHVTDIGRRLESDAIARYYPALGEREVSKYGISRGWAGNRMRTAAGFMIDAIGLDAAVRGLKAGDQRPDLIVLDDIDHLRDSPATVEQKIETITQSILPAGSTDMAVLGAQNLIHPNSVFSRLAGVSEHRADFLSDRIPTEVIPAIRGLATERQGDRDVIVAGEPVWEGQNLEECQGKISDFGLRAFLREGQHEVEAPPGGLFDGVDYHHCRPDEVPNLEKVVCWIDPAVTDTDDSDSHGIQIDGRARDGTIYRLWSWEQRADPEITIRTAILKAIEYGGSEIGFEINQGGDLWRRLYRRMVTELQASGEIAPGAVIPRFESERASGSTGDKTARASQMLVDYKRPRRIIHVLGTHDVLERAQRRFPKTKPLDLVDASYYAWYSLTGKRVMKWL